MTRKSFWAFSCTLLIAHLISPVLFFMLSHTYLNNCGLSRIKLFHFSIADASVKKHLQRAEEKLNRELQKEKAMYRGMFTSSLKSGSTERVNQTSRVGEGVLPDLPNKTSA